MPAFKQLIATVLLLTTTIDASSATHRSGRYPVNGKRFNVDTVISRDFTIVGGGSAGTYAAIRLQDLGYSVTVIEQTERLGGHTQTYVDPATGETIDYGVRAWHKFPEVNNYFARLNVSLVSSDLTVSDAVE
jgi:predicted NAD/FAD-binding protein